MTPGSRRSAADWDRVAALGRAIAAIRTERGMRRADLATQAGMSYTHLSEIENGKKEPSSRTLTAIAYALGMRPSDVVRRSDLLFEADRAEAPPADDWLERPAAALSKSAPKPSWFHERAMPAMLARAPEEPERPREDPLAELLAVARELPPEDVERLLDLARRLHG